MALIDRIEDVNRRIKGRQYYRLWVNGVGLGFVDTQLLADLDPALFTVDNAKRRVDVRFGDRLTFEKEIEQFFCNYFAKYQLKGWRNECYAVVEQYGESPLFLLERSALSYLGLTGYGVHVNGYVEKPDGLYMWVAKRAATKPTAPGKLDQIAAGGQPYSIGLMENVIKECEEEASIPAQIARTAVPVSAISYWYDKSVGMRPDIIFNYDLKLSQDFVPQVNDDEVASFTLYPMAELLEVVAETQQFKRNSAVVVIDFALRHGLITPDHRDYLRLQEGMNQRWRRVFYETLNQSNAITAIGPSDSQV